MTTQETTEKAIQQANERERHLWRHTRWLAKAIQIMIFLWLLYPFVVRLATAAPLAPAYPSCDLKTQRAIQGETGGSVTDPRQAHLSVRANILQADISTARKARRLSQPQADSLWQRVAQVRRDAGRFVKAQGFLSAGERASYDRELDAVASAVCRAGI
ncbi:hypothetical protein [Chimaeribacter coloradensis]|nr:hypothetical protein [Chimaeribacter coloradensis]